MKPLILGVGHYGVINQPGQIIKTYALGSCVAVIIHDKLNNVMGMDHVALPESKISPEKAKVSPGHFADSGLAALLKAMQQAGAKSRGRGLVVKLAGGANVADPNNTFSIGKRNILALKKELWKYGLGPLAEDVGGQFSRTVSASIDTGMVTLSSPGRDNWEI